MIVIAPDARDTVVTLLCFAQRQKSRGMQEADLGRAEAKQLAGYDSAKLSKGLEQAVT
jgi:hypothetical protein